MKRYYLKKATKQDVTRTTVLNVKAVEHFFGQTLLTRDDESYINLTYIPSGEEVRTRMVLKQDPRIFLDKYGLNPGDLILFERLDSRNFSIRYISRDTSVFEKYINLLDHRNYSLFDELPV